MKSDQNTLISILFTRMEGSVRLWSVQTRTFFVSSHRMFFDHAFSVGRTPDTPCTGWWSLYSRYSLYRVVEFILPILPVQGRGACSLANTRFCWSSVANALPVTTIGFSGIRTYNSLAANHYFWITYGHSWVFVTNASYSLIGNRVCFKWHMETGYNV